MDISKIRQRMMFWVEDCTQDSKITFNSEHFPTKTRPWIVVSNNKHNNNATTVTMVPVYTRSETKLPTQVFFINGDREQIAACEDVTTIPKHMIRDYIGTVNTYIWNRIQKALQIQFSDTDIPISDKKDDFIDDIMIQASKQIDMKNILVDKICNILIKGFTDSEITDTNNINDVIDVETNISDSEPRDINSNDTNRQLGRVKGIKTLPLNKCKEFYEDSLNMTIDQLNIKYSGYMNIKNTEALNNKRWKIKQRLKKHNDII